MTTEEKFNAAVNVIRSLPKNGPYQPSYDMMLKFYAYFKQATNGPCKGSRPGFWDVVGRAKYDSWKALGDLPKSKAMANYVEELHKIVETMSYTDNVANFMLAPTNDSDVNFSDLELIAGDVIEKVRSRSNSPKASREVSPNRGELNDETTPSTATSLFDETDHSDEEYIDSVEVRYFDTIDVPEPKKQLMNGSIHKEPYMNGVISRKEHTSRYVKTSNASNTHGNIDISQEISKAVQSIKHDIDSLTNKVNRLETKSNNIRRKITFQNVSPQFLTFIVVWPFIATFITKKIFNRN